MLVWINQLEPTIQDAAIKTYLEFDGTHPESGKPVYEWQKIIDKDYSHRKMALALSIDILMPFIEEKESMTFFDYFSKNAHWNPLTIKELTIKSDDETVTYKPFTLTLLSLTIALKAICGFTLFYTLSFVPEQQDIVDKLINIRDEFNACIGHAFQH